MNNNTNDGIRETLCLILTLQKESLRCNDNETCTKPYLGPSLTTICYNTRPITLYNCCNGSIWTFPYNLNGETGTSSIFRIENIEGDCATFRILIPTTDTEGNTTYSLSNSYFTIDLSCVSAMQCLNDAYVI